MSNIYSEKEIEEKQEERGAFAREYVLEKKYARNCLLCKHFKVCNIAFNFEVHIVKNLLDKDIIQTQNLAMICKAYDEDPNQKLE